MSGISPWQAALNPVQNGESVNANVTNRMPNQLAARTQYLKDILDAINAGSVLMGRDVAVAAGVEIGHVVYWDAPNQRYDKAIAKVAFDATLGGFTLAPSSFPLGICSFKYGSTRADIVLKGLAKFCDFTNGIGSVGNTIAEAGPYYLSATVAGMMTKQKPPVGVYCMFLRGDLYAHVDPTPREFLESHIHYALDLFAVPAGTLAVPAPGEAYEFLTTDSNLPGWLPAGHTIFGGAAPVGAKYGYNLSQHVALERLWPPLPNGNAYIEMNGLGIRPTRFIVDNTGLWWMNDCYGMAPWPTNEGICPSSSSSSSSSSSADNCPVNPVLEDMGFVFIDPCDRWMRIYFTKMVFKTNNALVTSLRAADGSPIVVTGCDGMPATTGDLKLDLNLALSIEENDQGVLALKNIVGQKFKRGPMVSLITPGPDMSVSILSGGRVGSAYYGSLLMNPIIPGRDSTLLNADLVALDSAREENFNGLFFLGLPLDRATGFTARVAIPSDILVETPMKLEMSFWILGRVAGVLPILNLKKARVAPAIDCTPQDLSAVTFNSIADLGVCTLTDPNTYVTLVSAAFDIAAGETIFVKVTRPGFGQPGDSYSGNIGIMRMTARAFTA